MLALSLSLSLSKYMHISEYIAVFNEIYIVLAIKKN